MFVSLPLACIYHKQKKTHCAQPLLAVRRLLCARSIVHTSIGRLCLRQSLRFPDRGPPTYGTCTAVYSALKQMVGSMGSIPAEDKDDEGISHIYRDYLCM